MKYSADGKILKAASLEEAKKEAKEMVAHPQQGIDVTELHAPYRCWYCERNREGGMLPWRAVEYE